jgi:hypothetical protein
MERYWRERPVEKGNKGGRNREEKERRKAREMGRGAVEW